MRGFRDAAEYLVAMPLLAAAAFAVFSAIIAAGWYAFLGWMWVLTILIPLPRAVGGTLSVICTALTVYGTLQLIGRLKR